VEVERAWREQMGGRVDLISDVAEPTLKPRRARVRLVGLIAIMLAAGYGLRAIAGPPRVPSRLPTPADVAAALGGSVVPLDALAGVLVALAWLSWLWIVGSLAIELLVVGAESAAEGAAWVRGLRAVANRLTLPLARRAVAAAFAVQVLSRGVGVAAAEPLGVEEAALVAPTERRDDNSSAGGPVRAAPPAGTYLVGAGDTLWSISESAYGSGDEYRRLVDANVGRRMPDGHLFSATGVIQPGWLLEVPDADWGVDEVEGQRWYTVKPGDTLMGIAARILADEGRWRDLFELNKGAARLGTDRTLSDPDLIWPGLRLRLPAEQLELESDQSADAHVPAVLGSVDLTVATAAVSPPQPAVQASAVPELAIAAAEPPLHVLPPLVRDLHPVPPFALDQPEELDVPDAAPEPPAAQPGVPIQALGVVALAAAAGAATLGARRLRRWRPLPQAPESEVVVEGGYAEARLTHEFARHMQGGAFEPLAAIVGQVQVVIDEYGLDKVEVVSAYEGRSSTTLTLAAGLAQQALLVDLVPEFGARLGAECEAWISADQDVVLRIRRVRKTRLLPAADSPQTPATCLLPLGVLYDRQVYSAAWGALGHVLVASLPGQGHETILTSLLATVTARRSPEEVRVWLIGTPRQLPAPLADLPHVQATIDPADETSLAYGVEHLAHVLEHRADSDPELVVVIPELMALGDKAADLARLASHGADAGVRIVAGTAEPDAASQSALFHLFATRLVLRMDDEETSVALLGVADAAFLDRGGRLLLRLDGREAVELYGYQVSTEHLERLVRLMRSAYPRPPAPAEAPTDDSPPDAQRGPAETAAPDPEPISEYAAPAVQPPASDESSLEDERSELQAVDADTPPLYVVCFGGPRVLYSGQHVWPQVRTGDAKPWELLLFLACQPQEGVAREDVTTALWPDNEDGSRAPHRFRQLRYRLRQNLEALTGQEVNEGICLERGGVLFLDEHAVTSDAQQFMRLLRMARVFPGPRAIARLEQARALYAGDLYAARESRRYAWVDERGTAGVTLREHFRRQFHQATSLLGELYVEADHLDAATAAYEELTDLDPSDERVWRALFRLQAQRGDRPALVREERRMRETLRELAADEDESPVPISTEPSSETIEEFQRLLSQLDVRSRAAKAV